MAIHCRAVKIASAAHPIENRLYLTVTLLQRNGKIWKGCISTKKLNSDLNFRFAERLHHAGRISTQQISNLNAANLAY
jgi:hypothetical protein